MAVDVYINPGSGSAREHGRCSERSAQANMRAFVRDLKLPGATHVQLKAKERDGRHAFKVRFGKHAMRVEMPGIALHRVRYVGREDQNIWHFPRLYVDGHSYVWKYAVSVSRDTLLGEP